MTTTNIDNRAYEPETQTGYLRQGKSHCMPFRKSFYICSLQKNRLTDLQITKHIPNAITCGNLFCGCVGIVAAFGGNLVLTAYLVGLAAVLDFADGMAARVLKAYSAIGKELDSLADCVTFGVLPSVVIFMLLQQGIALAPTFSYITNYNLHYIAFGISIFSALRLAIFNIDTRQTTSFIGLPTPANAIFFCSLPLVLHVAPQSGLAGIILNPLYLLIITLLFAYLLVSPLPLFSLKLQSLSFTANKIRYIFLGLTLVLIAVLGYIAVPFIIILYIFLSLIANIFKL